MLGVHIKVAVQWQQASGRDWAAYAADVISAHNADMTLAERQPSALALGNELIAIEGVAARRQSLNSVRAR